MSTLVHLVLMPFAIGQLVAFTAKKMGFSDAEHWGVLIGLFALITAAAKILGV